MNVFGRQAACHNLQVILENPAKLSWEKARNMLVCHDQV